MPLPRVKSIQRFLQSVGMDTGLDSALLKNLQVVRAETLFSNTCALLFDTISLQPNLFYNEIADKIEGFVDFGGERRKKEIANKAVVFMIQGLKEKFKQPVAYYFVHGSSPENLANFVREVIKAVENVGFNIVTVVCDHGPTNCEAMTLLKKTANLPPSANHFVVDGKKYFTVYDTPSLYEAIRNNFYAAGAMKFDGKVAKWQHLQDLGLAAQTVTITEYSQELADTKHVFELDKLFDSTNGPANGEEKIKEKQENVSLKTKHVEICDRFLDKISTLEFMKSDSKIQLERTRIVEGCKITINSLKDIWEDCEANEDYEQLNLQQLNQDSLQKLFEVIRQSSGGKPTCAQFTSAMKCVLISGISAPGQGMEYNDNVNKMLFVRSLKAEDLKLK